MAAENRIKIVLRCSECKQRNYNTSKNKKNTSAKLELKKVIWPTKKQIVNNTLVVLALVIASGIVIGGFDWVASNLIKLLISLFNA